MAEGYAQLGVHRWMLADSVRNEAYRQALVRAVRPGDVVLDMGAGTGILSVFAAQAGASRVWAVERTDIAAIARRVIERNGFADRITVIQDDLEEIDLPGKVDVIVSEWMGGLGVDENMLAPLLIARDRFLAPGGRVVPAAVTAMAAPMWIVEFDDSQAHWRSRPHGVDLSVVADSSANETELVQWAVTPEDMLAPAQVLWHHDAYRCSRDEADDVFAARLSFTVEREGDLSAIATWFDADMGGGAVLTTAPGAPLTHWGRMIFPLHEPKRVAVGARIEVELRCEPSSQGGTEKYWSVRIDDGPLEEHDTRPRRAAAFVRAR
ncbi:MAG: 50S ribosomal protein L11 methyltransferase [Nannocystaceae bacterium]